jgi:hypothetical protein
MLRVFQGSPQNLCVHEEVLLRQSAIHRTREDGSDTSKKMRRSRVKLLSRNHEERKGVPEKGLLSG